MAEQNRIPQEVRITVSVGPEDNILGHEELLIIHHAEHEATWSLLQRIEAAVREYRAGDAR